MRSSALNISALNHPSRLYRRELQACGPRLRFSPVVEREFVAFLRATQVQNLVLCIWIGLALWLGAMGWDVLRYVQDIQGTAMETRYLQIVPAMRLLTLAVLGGLLLGVRRQWWSTRLPMARLFTVSLYCAASFVIGYFYSTLGTSNAMTASILIMMVVFFPCGLAFREAMPVAAALAGAYGVVGVWVLPPQQGAQFWSTGALLLVCIAMMALSGYLRERGAREQFLLRSLLDWEADHDPLTGLANRRSFQRHFEICLAQARREGKTLLLVLLDLDHFKLYNDHYGNAAGDRALQQVALVLEHYAARPMDLAFRLGGEEFGLLSYADEAQALKQRMQHLRTQLQGLQIAHAFSPIEACVTVSIGIAQANLDETTDSLLQQADAQLARAKKMGRNQVCGPDRA